MGRRRRTFKVSFKGSLSSNKVYSTPHWTARNRMQKTWHSKFRRACLDAYPDGVGQSKISLFRVDLTCRNRLDIDNNSIMFKMFVDTLRELDWIVEDNTKHFIGMSIEVDKNMEPNTGEFVLKVIKYEDE